MTDKELNVIKNKTLASCVNLPSQSEILALIAEIERLKAELIIAYEPADKTGLPY